MRFRKCKIIFAGAHLLFWGLGLSEGRAGATELDFELQYAQSFSAWNTVGQVQAANRNPTQGLSLIQAKYGQPEVVLSNAEIRLKLPDEDTAGDTILTLGGEFLGIGKVENRVLATVLVDLVAAGTASLIHEQRFGEWGVSVGMIGALGEEKRAEAWVTDFIDGVPVRGGPVLVYGLQQGVSVGRPQGTRGSFSADVKLRELRYESTIREDRSVSAESVPAVVLDWKAGVGASVSRALSLHLILGRRPLPFELPLLWEKVYPVREIPEFGTLGGVEAKLAFEGPRTGLALGAGFYAGYPGGQARLRWRGLSLSTASYGIELTSAYHGLQQRLWISSLGLAL